MIRNKAIPTGCSTIVVAVKLEISQFFHNDDGHAPYGSLSLEPLEAVNETKNNTKAVAFMNSHSLH